MSFEKEQEYLKHYNPKEYRTPDGYTSDIAVFTIISETKDETVKAPPKRTIKIMLILRGEIDAQGNPVIESGKWALPGGFVSPNEIAVQTAMKRLEIETGVNNVHLKHFGVYDNFGRDKRGWIISNTHYAIVSEDRLKTRKATEDAKDVDLFTIEEALKLDLAFDHKKIITDVYESIKKEMVQTTIAKNFLPKEFTLSELRDVLLAVVSYPTIEEKSVFFKKTPTLPFISLVTDRQGNPKTTTKNSYRPAKLYTFVDVNPIASIYE